MSGTPVKKLPASLRIGSPSVPLTNRGGEEVNFTIGKENFVGLLLVCNLSGVLLCTLFGVRILTNIPLSLPWPTTCRESFQAIGEEIASLARVHNYSLIWGGSGEPELDAVNLAAHQVTAFVKHLVSAPINQDPPVQRRRFSDGCCCGVDSNVSSAIAG
jgi:hypothetical protein